MDFNMVCPTCFMDSGWSISMSEEKGIYFCPKNAQHKFKIGRDGFLGTYKPEYGF